MTTDSENLGGTDSLPPQDTPPAVPPYEGRRTSADVDTSGERADRDGAAVAGATGPVVDEEMKAPEPAETPRGGVASPADERPVTPAAEGEPADPCVGPAHSAGTPRGEDQS
jgi:hypothetical protein